MGIRGCNAQSGRVPGQRETEVAMALSAARCDSSLSLGFHKLKQKYSLTIHHFAHVNSEKVTVQSNLARFSK